MLDYILIFMLLLVAELAYFVLADKLGIVDKPNMRSSHTRITIRGGGFVFLLGVWVYTLFYGFHYPWFLAGLTVVSCIGLMDDIRPVPNKYRLVIHFVSMLMMFEEFGVLRPDNWWIILLGLILCVGIINAYNFMDGINGITGGYSLAVLAPLAYINARDPFVDQNLIIVSMLSLMVFCLFNFRKRARCFAGDVGSLGMAFIVIFILGQLIIRTGDFSYIIFLALYGIDCVLTICHRIMLGENLGEAHRKHAYQIMANELRIPHVWVSSFYMLLQLLISFGMVLLPVAHGIYACVMIGILGVSYILFMRRFYCLHDEYLKTKQ